MHQSRDCERVMMTAEQNNSATSLCQKMFQDEKKINQISVKLNINVAIIQYVIIINFVVK
jgi:hypothetical protein